ncbi:MAG: hypothetical protein ABFE13_03135 [Phycisphaerales bacterium]
MNATRNILMLACAVVAICVTPNVRADFIFGEPVTLGPVVNSSPYSDYAPSIAPDGLSLYFSSQRPGGLGLDDIWVTTRATMADAWGPPVSLGATVNSTSYDWGPAVTPDGLTLYFTSDRPGGLGKQDIWLTTRPTKEDPWGKPVNLGAPINSVGDEFFGCISADGCSLHFSTSAGPCPLNPAYYCGGDIYITTRPTADSPWGPPVDLELMASRGGSGNWDPSVSADGLALFFDSDYVNVNLFPDVWLATRTRDDSSWGTPILLGPEINTQNGEARPSISPDGRTLYFSSNRPNNSGDWNLWQVAIAPIVDFNTDGAVDLADLVMLIDNWGTAETLYDIGPFAWGDGVVDVQDLKVFIAEWEKANPKASQDEQ